MPIKKERALNSWEMEMLSVGLNMYQEDVCKEIREVIRNGRQPIMTEGFIIMEVEQLKKKLSEL